MEEFWLAYRAAWLTDKKGAGLEVQDARLGGLKMRLADCRLRLSDYVEGKLDVIDDLEQPLIETEWSLNGYWGSIITTSCL